MRARLFFLLLAGPFQLYLLIGLGAAQEKPMRLNLAYSSISASQAIVRVIKDAGIFQRSGLDANVIFIGGGTGVIQALLAGDVPIAIVSGEPSILARLQGAETLILAGLVNIMDFSIISAPEVKRPQDLKGKKLRSAALAPPLILSRVTHYRNGG